MLGHKLWQVIRGRADAFVTFRQSPGGYERFGIFDPRRAVGPVSAQDFDSIIAALASVRPDAVVNCIGIVKQDASAKDPIASIGVNSLFPHRLAQACSAAGARLIHISTDCVFSGRKGGYLERDAPDAEDLYGRSKLLGEVDSETALTLRTSMIGRELQGSHGLVEWFLGQRGQSVSGFRRAVFSGFTTEALAEIIFRVITRHPGLQGVWHVAAEPVNKFELLSLIKRVFDLDIEIKPDETFVCDRSLDAGRFWRATGLAPPSWPEMIEQMRRDTTPYEELRRINAYR